MRIIIFIVFISSIKLFSQEINYQLYLKNSCNDSIKKADFYTLEKDNIEYNISNFDSSIIKVPLRGKYKLTILETDEIYTTEITLEHTSDTLTLPSIELHIFPHPPSFRKDISRSELKKIRLKYRPIYKSCGLPINGKKIDYFSNGNVRLLGNFKNGYPIGEIREYYQNGEIKEIINYDNEGLIIKSIKYDEKGAEIKN